MVQYSTVLLLGDKISKWVEHGGVEKGSHPLVARPGPCVKAPARRSTPAAQGDVQ
jgi:hypothetical protein